MLFALALLLLAAQPAAAQTAAQPGKPLVALLPLKGLGVPADVQLALQETLRNELAAIPEAALVADGRLADALRREPDCETRIACAAAAAARAGARVLIVGTASQLGDAFMIDLKLVDAGSARELRRATHPVSGSQDALIETLRAAAVELLAPARYAGSLHIEVQNGEGAEVFVDGKPIGKAPLPKPVEALVPGQHTVRVAGQRDTSTFAEVRFDRRTDVRIDLAAPRAAARPAPTAVPAPVLLGITTPPPRSPALRIAGISGLGLGVVAAIVAVGFHAHAYATAAELNRREQLNELKTSDLAAYGAVDSDVSRARAFYATAGVLAAAGAGLLLWDLHLERKGLAIDPGQATLRF